MGVKAKEVVIRERSPLNTVRAYLKEQKPAKSLYEQSNASKQLNKCKKI